MLKNIEEYKQANLPPADVCIIGAGPAGIALARSFLNSKFSVTLLEGGFIDFDWQTQNLNQLDVVGLPIRQHKKTVDTTKPYTIDEIFRDTPDVRQFGGAYRLWNGVWRTSDPVDFHEKSYYRLPSWPIPFSEITRYYKTIADEYFVKGLMGFKQFLNENETGLITDVSALRPVAEYRINPHISFDTLAVKSLKKSPNIHVITGANVVKLELAENKSHITGALIRSINKKEWQMNAQYFILCCGAIQNARLLLLSNNIAKNGIGNDNDLVGRNLICSPEGIAGLMAPISSEFKVPEATYRGDKRFRVGIALNSKLQEKKKLPNHCCFLERVKPQDGKAKPKTPSYYLHLHLEQLPNKDSRISLSEKKDALGTPIPLVNWKFSNRDKLSLDIYIKTIIKIFWDNRFAKILIPKETASMNFLKNTTFMGTTRMGASPKEGVVDQNCKVFGIDNLYISGTSIFPTSGNTSSFFTLHALARRLADHIKTILTKQ